MSRKLKGVIILAVILVLMVGSILFILLRPSKWSREIAAYLNDNVLRENGWVMSVESMDGQFTSDVLLKNLYLRKIDGSMTIFSESSLLNLDFSEILAGNWAISELACENALITMKQGRGQGLQEITFIEDLIRRGFGIRNLHITKTSVIVQDGARERLYAVDLNGRISSERGLLAVSPENFEIIDLQTRTNATVTGGKVEVTSSGIHARMLQGTVAEIPYTLSGEVILSPEQRIDGEVAVLGITPGNYLASSLQRFLPADRVDLTFHLVADSTSRAVHAMVCDSRDSRVLADARLELAKLGDEFSLRDGTVRIGSCELKGKGVLGTDGTLNLEIGLADLNLEEFGLVANTTDIGGSIQLSASLKGKKVEEVLASVALQNGERGSEGFVKTTGRIAFKDNRLEFPDSLLMDFDYGTVLASGGVDLGRDRMNVSLTADNVNLRALNYIFGLDQLRGNVEGTLDLFGFAGDPSLRGLLTIENGEYSQASISSGSVSLRINSLLSDRNGSMTAHAKEGRLFGHAFDRGEIDIYFQGDTVQVANARLDGGGDYLKLSGKIVGTNSFMVDQMQLSFRNEYFTNVGQVSLHRLPEGLILDPVAFQMRDGTADVAFVYRDGELESGTLRIANLHLESLWSVLNKDVSLLGSAFADFSAETADDQLRVDGKIEVKDGSLKGTEFHNLLFAANLENDLLSIKELKMTGPDRVRLELSGFCGVRRKTESGSYAVDPESDVEFSSEFENFELRTLAGYFPEGWDLGGSATGSLAMTGVARSPEMDFQFTLKNPYFEETHGGTISASGRYIGQRLYFDDLVGYTKTGQYTGEGYLPVDFALVPEEKDRFIESDSISMRFAATTSSMDFLTPYFSDVDSVKGDFKINLSIEGTPEKPVRNGWVKVNSGEIYVLMLDAPIESVNGSVKLENNKLIIEELLAASHMPPELNWAEVIKSNLSLATGGVLFGKEKKDRPPNIRLKGSMDMEKFFRPNLAFLVTGEDVYVRTLLGEIEGIADLDLSVTGQDTISIVGDIIPHESVLRMEFGGGGDYSDVQPQGKTITRYKLHFPIEGNLFVRNSQINAELEGDMSIFKLGNGPYRYSGELNVLSGKFYYYSDVFDIQEGGNLVFDPSEFKFNPKIDIQATTRIAEDIIEVALSGDFDEPKLTIQSLGENYYSQGDLLQLLMIQRQFEEETDLGTQSVNLLGKYLKSELERGVVRATPLLDEFEVEDVEGGDRSVRLGTRFSSNLYLSYKQSFSLSERQVGVEYRLNRNVSMVVTYDENTGEMHLKYRRKYKF